MIDCTCQLLEQQHINKGDIDTGNKRLNLMRFYQATRNVYHYRAGNMKLVQLQTVGQAVYTAGWEPDG